MYGQYLQVEGLESLRASEKSLTEGRDGCGGKDSHESIINHGARTIRHQLAPPPTEKDGYMLQTLQ
jgi:hypothetical protein